MFRLQLAPVWSTKMVITRPPARTALGVGGLLGGLDEEERYHVAILNGMVFSLDVQPTREDRWDRAAIVRGFWACRGFGL